MEPPHTSPTSASPTAYHITLLGAVDVDALNLDSPLRMDFLSATLQATAFAVQTDQSGLIGLLRHLHNLGGLTLLSIVLQPGQCPLLEEPDE